MKTRAIRLAGAAVVAERRSGNVYLRSPHPLPAYPRSMTERLEHWAARTPQQVWLAQRGADGSWRQLTYAEARRRARRVAGGLLERGLSAERPLAVLSGNDIEHALLELAAMYIGVPYAPVSPAYSLISTDFAQLRRVVELTTPGLIYVSNRKPFQKAIDAVAGGIELIDRLPERDAEAEVDAASARVGPDTIAKFLFTSGSTGAPKAVINTQRMWCSNQEMVRQVLAFVQDEPPVMVGWAPWHHTAGGNKDFGMVLYNGGTMYLDEGKPLPGAIETTVRNLREVAPNWYFTVPKGYEMLLPHLKKDLLLRENFFSRLKALWFAGAGVSQHVFDEYKKIAYETCGEEILFLTGLGSTETAPFTVARTWDTGDATNMGVPVPGAEMKLVPLGGDADGRYEARLKGPHITPGYWRQAELTRQAFDEEGYYRLGDAFAFADESDPAKGLLFRGRISEDFKLATGTWVHVGPLRNKFIAHFAPYVRDVVIAGEGRAELAALVFPAMPFPPGKFEALLKTFESTGSSNRIARAVVLEEPPSLDAGEMTDKGSINQKAVLKRRAGLVAELYSRPI
ncbi:MAG TPA: feruloyl-CoA synthase [Burkholderiales bacterium]|nr:feruloyl-CoA synthase [Burkholderiales bacterium]